MDVFGVKVEVDGVIGVQERLVRVGVMVVESGEWMAGSERDGKRERERERVMKASWYSYERV